MKKTVSNTKTEASLNNFNIGESTSNKQLILSLSKIGGHPFLPFFLNDLVLSEGEKTLYKYGKIFQVKPGKSRKKCPIGMGYANAAEFICKGYKYVEGYKLHKNTGRKIAHAWNIDPDGNSVDFTIKDPEQYEYFGVVIPDILVYEVGLKNGGIWYCVLPFIDSLNVTDYISKN